MMQILYYSRNERVTGLITIYSGSSGALPLHQGTDAIARY